MNKKGFGVEDTPFMIIATVAVLMFVVWAGVLTMEGFVTGNEYQAAIEASTEIYKRAKLLTLGYDGSSDRLRVIVPEGYKVLVDGSIVTLGNIGNSNGSVINSTRLTEPLSIQGVSIFGEDSKLIEPGEHKVDLLYHAKDGEVIISWD